MLRLGFRYCRLLLLCLVQTGLVILLGLIPGLFFLSFSLLFLVWRSLPQGTGMR